MCSSEIMGHIEDVVTNLVEEQIMFTAYDVTCKVREIVGKGVNIRHNDIKNDIHKEVAQHLDGDYQKSLEDVGAPAAAFVYYHFMNDPATYEPKTRNDSVVDDSYSDSDTVTVASPDNHFVVDSRCRLLIPITFMQHLDVEVGDEVKIYKETGFIVLSKDDMSFEELACLKVDGHGYLYLSAKILNQGDLGDTQKFDIETHNNTVKVTKA